MSVMRFISGSGALTHAGAQTSQPYSGYSGGAPGGRVQGVAHASMDLVVKIQQP